MLRLRRHCAGLILAVGLLSPPLGTPAWAEGEEDAARASLAELQAQIKSVTNQLDRARNQLSTEQKQLREAERRLGQLQQAIGNNREAIRNTEAELASLASRSAELEAARDRQQVRIGTELRAAWQMGQQGTVKVLLNQESPHTVARAMAYYRYFFQARNELVVTYRATLAELAAVAAHSEAAARQLGEQQAELQSQQEALLASRAEREQAIAALATNIRNKDDELQQLERDREELEQLLESIKQAIVEIELPADYKPFASRKGSMTWPVDARRNNSFGASRGLGGMRWQGINLTADEGSTVRAIHHGRVVFADWLRGSGLLLIVDHGDGYMSLYAHNQSLLKEVGEWVAPGTPVSTVGSSGGLERAALYFEIRKDGKPLDPVAWCR
jgi:septal ring factor EnvC (AmiA/AmiB activator)